VDGGLSPSALISINIAFAQVLSRGTRWRRPVLDRALGLPEVFGAFWFAAHQIGEQMAGILAVAGFPKR
jgi:hypothetical protein